MTNKPIELKDDTRERLDKYVEERGAFPLHLTCETHDDLINSLLDKIERLEDKCERIKTQSEEQADLDREVLFDACLIGMQRAIVEEFNLNVSTLKIELFENIRLGAIWTGNNEVLPQRNDGTRETHEWVIYDRVRAYFKTRGYDHPVFKEFDKWRR